MGNAALTATETFAGGMLARLVVPASWSWYLGGGSRLLAALGGDAEAAFAMGKRYGRGWCWWCCSG